MQCSEDIMSQMHHVQHHPHVSFLWKKLYCSKAKNNALKMYCNSELYWEFILKFSLEYHIRVVISCCIMTLWRGISPLLFLYFTTMWSMCYVQLGDKITMYTYYIEAINLVLSLQLVANWSIFVSPSEFPIIIQPW